MYVAESNTTSISAVLGRDVLNKFGYKLKSESETMLEKCVENNEELSNILNIEINSDSDETTKDLNINVEIPINIQNSLIELYKHEYIQPKRPKKPEHDDEIKLILKEHQPFYFTPRRLYYMVPLVFCKNFHISLNGSIRTFLSQSSKKYEDL